MNGFGSIFVIVGTASFLGFGTAIAGPCSEQIAAFEASVREAPKTPTIGVTAPQSNAAQLHRQPTPTSVTQAEDKAQTTFEAALARAKAFDEQGKPAECARALDDAKMMFASR